VLNSDQLGALTFLVFAAAIALQALYEEHQRQAMLKRLRRLPGTIVSTRSKVETDSEGTTWYLYLMVDTAEGPREPRPFLTESAEEMDAVAAAYPVGKALTLVIDPRYDLAWPEAEVPDRRPSSLWMVALALFALAVALWFGWHHLIF
jgi:hypothetical protein